MKHVFSFLMALMLTFSAFAQKDVTKFLGIPVDGTKTQMTQKLIAKGFTPKRFRGKDYFEGEFNGRSVRVYIATNNNKVYRIMVCDEETLNETDIKIRFNILVDQFKNNKRYVSLSDFTIPKDENISYEMSVNKKSYDAMFFQAIDTENIDTLAVLQNVKTQLLKKYTAEQIENPSDEIKEELQKEINNINQQLVLDIMNNKRVWFCITKYDYNEYSITMFYDNEYNKAHGEDL